ncbi:VCBS domain-containing protein, partial [Escherichia coli]|uniref:VCBS domain-containing protein n=3 Tax=Pseudomonadota TaxID=1224 RepID=UPI0015E5C157
ASEATVLSWLSLGALVDSTDGVTGSRSWTFSAADRYFDYLAAGETLTLAYTVQIDDHHGGVVTLPVTITIVGTDDKPVIT